MRRLAQVVGMVIAMGVFIGCSALQVVDTATSVYNAGRAGATGYSAYKSTKSFENPEPLFTGYDSVQLECQISPRDKKNADALISAFTDNYAYIVQTDLAAAKSSTKICSQNDCNGNVLVLQFKELAFDGSMTTRILQGDQLKGELYYIQKSTGTILRKENIEGLSSYAEVLRGIHSSVSSKLVKGLEGKNDAEAVANLTKVDPLKPEYQKIFKKT